MSTDEVEIETRTQRLRTTALPHPYREDGLEFTITDCTLDPDRDVDIQSGSRLIQLTSLTEWDHATVTGSITVPDDLVSYVFPDDEQDDPPGTLFVAIRCQQTILRDREIVKDDSVPAREYLFEFDLDRAMIRGGVELQPYLVRADDRSEVNGRYATDIGARLASSDEWLLKIDDTDLPEGLLRPHIENFSEMSELPSGDHLHYLDMSDAERPTLYLNGDHSAIINVMESRGSTGPDARMRDTIYDLVEASVWPQLIIRTATDINQEGKTRYDWQDDVLDLFHDKLYDDADVEEAAMNLREDVNDEDQLVTLMQHIDDAVQQKTEPPEQLINLLEEGLK